MRIESSKYLEDLEKCVLCGNCKALCPTYGEEMTEPASARGRLMLLKGLFEGSVKPSKLLIDRIFGCILCGACAGRCPLGVDITGAIYHGRALLQNEDKGRRHLRSLAKFSFRRPELSFKIMRMSRRLILPFLASRGIIPFSPELPEAPLRRADQVFKTQKRKGRVAVFTGCSINYLFPHLGESLIHVLQHFGYEVVLPKGEVCCGAPLRGLGLEKEAEEQAKRNFRVFSRLKVDAIVSLCPTCTLYLKKEYPKIIGKGLEKAMDMSVFFRDKLEGAESIQKTSVYHDPCHLLHGLGVKKEPREIIKMTGIGLIEMGDEGCCGMGGLFCLSYKDISENLLNRRTKAILGSNADTIITSCPGCIMQLSRTITDRPVLHLIELIEEAYCFRPLDRKKEDENELTLF
jgi:glycolate oxidase iron-sulfur subunit